MPVAETSRNSSIREDAGQRGKVCQRFGKGVSFTTARAPRPAAPAPAASGRRRTGQARQVSASKQGPTAAAPVLRTLLMETSSLMPFRRRVLTMNSLASALAGAGSSGRSTCASRRADQPAGGARRSDGFARDARCSCRADPPAPLPSGRTRSSRRPAPACTRCRHRIQADARAGRGRGVAAHRRSVSKPKDSMAGRKQLTLYSGVPGIATSCVTWPRRRASTV